MAQSGIGSLSTTIFTSATIGYLQTSDHDLLEINKRDL
jgi:hypothetical protein